MWGSPQLVDNFVFKEFIVLSIDHHHTYICIYIYIYIYINVCVVMSWDVLSVGVSTAD